MISRPASVRTRVSVQSLNAPMPPVEMSACSAAKSGHSLQPSRVNAWHSLRGTSTYRPSCIQICRRPLMFIFLISARFKPYLASSSSSKIASSKVFEHNSPMLSTMRRPTLPALRWFITGGTELWQLIPTSASFSAPLSIASSYAIVLAEYV